MADEKYSVYEPWKGFGPGGEGSYVPIVYEAFGGPVLLEFSRPSPPYPMEFSIILPAEAGNQNATFRYGINVYRADDFGGTLRNQVFSATKYGSATTDTYFPIAGLSNNLQPNTLYRAQVRAQINGVWGLPWTFDFWTNRKPSVDIVYPLESGGVFTYNNLESFHLEWYPTDPDQEQPLPEDWNWTTNNLTRPGVAWRSDYAGYEVQWRLVGEENWDGTGIQVRQRSGVSFSNNNAHKVRFEVNLGDPPLGGADAPLSHQFGPGNWEIRVRVFDYSNQNSTSAPVSAATASDWVTTAFSVEAPFLPPILEYPIDGEAVEYPGPTGEITFGWDFRDPRTNVSTVQCAREIRIREAGTDTWTTILDEQGSDAGEEVMNRWPHPQVQTGSPFWDWFLDYNGPAHPSETAEQGAALNGYWIRQGFYSSATGSKGLEFGFDGDHPERWLPALAGQDIVATPDEALGGLAAGNYRFKMSAFGGFLLSAFPYPGQFGVGIYTPSTNTWVTSLATLTPAQVAAGERVDVILDFTWVPGDSQFWLINSRNNSMVLVDKWIITDQAEGDIPYFDGSFPPDGTYSYEWEGLSNLSRSIRTSLAAQALPETYAWANGDGYTIEQGHQYEWQVRTVACPGDFDSGWTAEIEQFWVVAPPLSGGGLISTPDANVTLGCGTHRVFVYERGGLNVVGELTEISTVRWNRVRDDISKATVWVTGWSQDCGKLLADLRSWVHEIVIFRDSGAGPVRVWEGPVTRVGYENERVEIEAGDVMTYVYRRILRQGYSDTYRYITSATEFEPNTGLEVIDVNGRTFAGGRFSTWRAKKIIQNALAYDDPNVLPYLSQSSFGDDAREVRSAQAYSRTAWQEVDDLAAKAGMDYTTMGRRILLFDTHRPPSILPDLTDGDFDNSPVVTEYGMRLANYYAVTNNNGIYGEAFREAPSYYGWVEMLVSSWGEVGGGEGETMTPEQIEAAKQVLNEQAERGIDQRWPTPLVVRMPNNSQLRPEANIDINQLIPGGHCLLHAGATLRRVRQIEKLDEVSVEETDKGEAVRITFSQASGFYDPSGEEGEGGEE